MAEFPTFPSPKSKRAIHPESLLNIPLEFNSFDKDLIKLFEPLRLAQDFKLLEKIFRDQKRVEPAHPEPTDILSIN